MPNSHARFTLLLLAALALACASARAQAPAAKEAPSTVEGRVTDGDEGLVGVGVALVIHQTNSGRLRTVARTKTDHEGRYRLTGVPPGRYQILPAAPAHVMNEWQVYPPGRALMLAAGETVTDIDFRLVRGGVITGRVTDADGRPVVGEQVQLAPVEKTRPTNFGFFTQSQRMLTDDRGVYRVYGLPAGRYRVSVGQDAGSGSLRLGARRYYRRTFHPDATDEAQARVVEVTAGGEAADVDITVGRAGRTYSATGRFVGTDGRPAPGVRVGYGAVGREQRSVGVWGAGVATNARGEFALEGLAPGAYAVFSLTDEDAPAETYSDVVRFEVTDSDVGGLEVRLRRGASVSGVVQVEGTNDRATVARVLGRLKIMAHVEAGRGGLTAPTFANASVAPDGSFRAAGLRPGQLRIGLGWPQQPGVTLSRVEVGGVPQRDGIEVAEGAQLTNVRVVVSYGTAVVRGQINVVNGTLTPEARLVVFARHLGQGEEAAARGLGRRGAQVDARGHFAFEGLPAGEYEITARLFTREGERGGGARQTVSVPEGGEAAVALTLDLAATPAAPTP